MLWDGLPEGEKYSQTPGPGTKEAHEYMWSIDVTALELTYNGDSEEDACQEYHTGNEDKDGFGH